MVDSAWWGMLAEMWCHVLEYASLVWRTVLAIWVERGFGEAYESISLRHCSQVALRPIDMFTVQEVGMVDVPVSLPMKSSRDSVSMQS